MAKRPYLLAKWIEAVLSHPLDRQLQPDGRIRLFGRVVDASGKTYILRVVVLEDGETVHNAFFDRDYREDER